MVQDSYGDLDPQHDGAWSGPPRVSYVVCSVARSGSTLLGSLLWDTGLAGKPVEYFHPVHATKLIRRWHSWGLGSRLPARYWDRVPRSNNFVADAAIERYARDLVRYRTTPNGRFGVKMHYSQYEKQLGLRPLEALFPNLRYISITREDRVAQAVSWWKASQSGQWAAGDPKRRDPTYSFAGILRLHCEILREEQGWDDLFESRGISPLRVTYEAVSTRPDDAVRSALLAMDVADTVGGVSSRMQRQSDPTNRDWSERYLRTLERRGLVLAASSRSAGNGKSSTSGLEV
jgi:LPS sulfotransferase NodH